MKECGYDAEAIVKVQDLLEKKAPPPTKDEIEKLLAIAPKYGIEISLPGA